MRKLSILLCAILAATTTLQAAIITVGVGGDHVTIDDAITAALGNVDATDTISLITDDASTAAVTQYPGTVTIPGGQTFIIQNDSGGTVTLTGPGVSGNWSVDASVGVADVTIIGCHFFRDTGTGAVFDVNQDATNTVDLTFNDCTFYTEASHALRVNDGSGAAGGAAVTVVMDGCSIDARFVNGSRDAVRMQSDGRFDNVNVTISDTTILAAVAPSTGAGIRIDGVSGQENNTWTLNNVTISAPVDRGFEVDDAILNASYTLNDCTIFAEEEGVLLNDPHTNSTFVLNRCFIDNSAVVTGDRTVDIRMGTSGSGNSIDAFNNIVIAEQGAGRALHIGGGTGAGVGTVDIRAHHNTLVGAGTGADRGLNIDGGWNALAYSNNIIQNFSDPFGGSSTGSTRSGNLIAGSTNDSSLGVDRIFDTIGALNLDSTFTPQDPTNAAGEGDPAIAAVVGNVDHNNTARINGGSNPDIGAIETASLPVELSTFTLD
jgi:hypothetical protein